MDPDRISIGDLARKVDLSTATINFYVKEGIIPPPERINRTRAAYSERHARILRLVKKMQGVGMTLANVKLTLHHYGTDDRGLRKLESIGLFQPLPLLRIDRTGTELEHFDPVGRADLAKRAGVDEAFVRRLEKWGILIPARRGRYDVRDLWLIRAVKSMVDDGVPFEQLEFLVQLLPVAQKASDVLFSLGIHHRERLRSRELRFRDVMQPLLAVVQYLLGRLHDLEHPDWQRQILESGPAQSRKRRKAGLNWVRARRRR